MNPRPYTKKELALLYFPDSPHPKPPSSTS